MASIGKKKVTQNELRRIMSEQKKKLLDHDRKVDSPLAKYKEDGTLTCILCESVVRSNAVWIVHINSKQHKDNIGRKKQMLAPPPPPDLPKHVYKRPCTPPANPIVPQKKLKGILKNAPTPKLPEDFFEKEIKRTSLPEPGPILSETVVSHSVEEQEMTMETDEDVDSKDPLPEGFFDDPIMDAKARHVEYKDPVQEEWERFQKEIKEETTVSTQIIEDDQEEATAERQIQEIDEQLRNWTRVLDLEKKKETVQAVSTKPSNGDLAGETSDEDEDFDEFLDWRAKKSFK